MQDSVADLAPATRQQDPLAPRDRRRQVALPRPGQEAQGCQQGKSTPPTLLPICTGFPPQLSKRSSAQPRAQSSNTKIKASLTNAQVNPEIIGGLVVEIGDRTIDLSVSSRIAKLNKLLTDTL